ncbi:phospholipid transfer protein-like isoform X2 [Simochromis diagramma]|uniref:phospholipid transfer protein-like isoform X2 n=1 Tax=Simochromis diagramma TaxID=43689 RepID=UPI001A7E64C4|nr:phospholipid transfer protein-like isoform X2 [Simochromis diagramma]
MTPCVFSLLFLFLMSSTDATDPTGLQLRITNKSFDVLKDVGLGFLNELVNNTFPDFSYNMWKIFYIEVKRLTITSLAVDPRHMALHLLENSGLQFQIEGLNITGELERDIIVFGKGRQNFKIEGVNTSIEVKLSQNLHGHMTIEIPKCELKADDVDPQVNSNNWWLWDNIVKSVSKYLLQSKVCPALQKVVVPNINKMLNNITMAMTLDKDLNISIDYSLSKDIEVTSHNLDVPFKGLVFRQGQGVDAGSIRAGTDPVFTQTDQMIYVGISEFLFNSVAMMLYKSGPFHLKVPKIDTFFGEFINVILSKLGLPVSCKLNMKTDFEGSRLVLLSKVPKCDVDAKGLIKYLADYGLKMKITDFLESWFDEGVLIPLPKDLVFIEGKIQYHDGFLVAGGNLNFTSLVQLRGRAKPQAHQSQVSQYQVSVPLLLFVIVIVVGCGCKKCCN